MHYGGMHMKPTKPLQVKPYNPKQLVNNLGLTKESSSSKTKNPFLQLLSQCSQDGKPKKQSQENTGPPKITISHTQTKP
jgi:hypothetical protein